jgi:hypothetical protein
MRRWSRIVCCSFLALMCGSLGGAPLGSGSSAFAQTEVAGPYDSYLDCVLPCFEICDRISNPIARSGCKNQCRKFCEAIAY